ncbi:hypothetical protein SAMN05216570_1327 [Dyella sp. OK004]|uniref:hypothetical protein n=1 Tax=Dyella sp. OK004 TaxID=1855292 RepID=UPI0008ED83C2|nr:hypothetical protein [Dyella sp. OK004]SFR96031.1 hypothetical protein SAMN05216570_1327 [Dyella sp. OK004]
MSMTWPPAPARSADDAQTTQREITAHFQASVDAGFAYWRINDRGHTELHFHSGEVFQLNESGVTRLR